MIKLEQCLRNALVPVFTEIEISRHQKRKPNYSRMLNAALKTFKHQLETMSEWHKEE